MWNCSKLTIITWCRSNFFIVNLEHISCLFLVFLVDFEQVNISWVLSHKGYVVSFWNSVNKHFKIPQKESCLAFWNGILTYFQQKFWIILKSHENRRSNWFITNVFYLHSTKPITILKVTLLQQPRWVAMWKRWLAPLSKSLNLSAKYRKIFRQFMKVYKKFKGSTLVNWNMLQMYSSWCCVLTWNAEIISNLVLTDLKIFC